jgi:hypothetical protein
MNSALRKKDGINISYRLILSLKVETLPLMTLRAANLVSRGTQTPN